jgi:hypothetical protein
VRSDDPSPLWRLGRMGQSAAQPAESNDWFSHASRISRGTERKTKNAFFRGGMAEIPYGTRILTSQSYSETVLLSHVSPISRGVPRMANFIYPREVWLNRLIWLKAPTPFDDFRFGLATLAKLAGGFGDEQK